jgi:predicted transcriptional regulator
MLKSDILSIDCFKHEKEITMKAIFIVLNKESYLEDILMTFVELGVKGATILESQGMAGAMLQVEKNIPFFGALKQSIENIRPFNKTIFTVVNDEKLLDRAIERINMMFNDVKRPGLGFMFVVPIDGVYPLGKK